MTKKNSRKTRPVRKTAPAGKPAKKRTVKSGSKTFLQRLFTSQGMIMIRDMGKSIAHYFIRFIVRPSGAAAELAKDSNGLWTGFWWNAFFYFAYALIALLYWGIHHLPQQKLFLNIPADSWYLMQAFTTIPAGMAGILSFSGIAFLLAKAMGGRGSFEKTFSTQSFAMLVPAFLFMLIPEGLFFPFIYYIRGIQTLPWPKIIELFRTFILPDIWMIIISVIALKKVHGINWIKSAIVFLAASIPAIIIMAVFIR